MTDIFQRAGEHAGRHANDDAASPFAHRSGSIVPERSVRIRGLAIVPAVVAILASAHGAGATTFDCVMEPTQKVKVGSAVTGILKSMPVRRGDLVKAGQVIATLDDSVEAAAVVLAETQAASSEAIEAQKARVKLAHERLERAKPLALKDIVSRDKLEGIEADYEVAVRDLNTEMVKHRLAEIEVMRAKATLALRTIKSPLTGLVVDRNLQPGEFVNQEAFIMTLAQLDPLYVEAYIPVRDYRSVKVGMTGTVMPAEPIGGTYKAPITVVDRVFDAASGTFQVRLELPNPGSKLPGGERCKVDLDFADAVDVAGEKPVVEKPSADRPALETLKR